MQCSALCVIRNAAAAAAAAEVTSVCHTLWKTRFVYYLTFIRYLFISNYVI